LQYEKSSHSAWLKTLAENGIPGVILLAAMVGSFAYAGLRQGHPDQIAVGLLVTTILALSFLTTQFQSKGLWFLVAGGIVFLHHRQVPRRSVRKKSRGPVLHGGMLTQPSS